MSLTVRRKRRREALAVARDPRMVQTLHRAARRGIGGACTLHMGEQLRAAGELTAARALIEAALRGGEDGAAFWAKLGQIATALDDNEAALAAFEQALARKPDASRLIAYADVAVRLGRFDDALSALDKVSADDPRRTKADEKRVKALAARSKALTNRARELSAAGRRDEAIALLRKGVTVDDAHAAEPLMVLGRLLIDAGDPREGAACLERSVALRPGQINAWVALAGARRKTSGVEGELAVLDRAFEAIGWSPRLAVARARLWKALGRIVEADAEMDRAATAPDVDRATLLVIGRHHLSLGRSDRAHTVVGRLSSGDDLPVEFRIAEALRHEGRDSQRAVDALTAICGAPDFALRAHGELARLAALRLDAEEARRQLSLAARDGVRRYGIQRELVNEMRVHGPAVERARTALNAGDMAGLLKALRDEPTSTAIAAVVLSRIAKTQPQAVEVQSEPPSPTPKLIHQFWDTAHRPEAVERVMASWREANPSWRYQANDMTSAREYLRSLDDPRLALAFRRANTPAQKADILRLVLLREFGGVYADADDFCLAPIESWIGGAEFVVATENYGSVGNNLIAVTPSHPVITAALEDALEATLTGGAESIWLRTGPGCLTRALALHLAEDPARLDAVGSRILLLDPATLQDQVRIHCPLDYKATSRNWQKGEFPQQAAARA